jgi:hypothetical protein
MLKKISIAIVVLVAAFLVVVALQPSGFTITRSATIASPAAAVFAQVNNFHHWSAWSPWAKLDPAMKETYEGPEAGTGAVYSWDGNSEVGAGRMTLIESRTNELVRIKLEFLRPFASVNSTDFTFQPQGDKGDQTAVTWTMAGKNNFMSKAFCLFMNMDKIVGEDFEKGLAQMKALVENAGKK